MRCGFGSAGYRCPLEGTRRLHVEFNGDLGTAWLCDKHAAQTEKLWAAQVEVDELEKLFKMGDKR